MHFSQHRSVIVATVCCICKLADPVSRDIDICTRKPQWMESETLDTLKAKASDGRSIFSEVHQPVAEPAA